MEQKKPLGITDVVLRDAHQSLFATRLRLDDMLPIADRLDQVGFWSLESWGGATFDACIRFLGEDPWERIRELKKAMPNTPQQMLLRGQNILGYRHYADDIVDKFVERSVINGVDVFRVFDAMNDPRNLERAITAVRKQGKHAQGTLSFTVSPVHDLETWMKFAHRLSDMGAHSIAIKDMAGLLKPYVAYELVRRLKKELDLPIHMQCHATTGMSTATYLKAIEAGIDNVDTAISSMSMTYGHSSTEALVAILEGTERETGLKLELLEEIAAYFREIRKKYSKYEGSLKGTDSRILVAQVPGGMLTNLENQLREQDALDRLDDVLSEIPRVRKDLGFIPLVTPTSQIVGTQAVINVVLGERYKSIARETEGVLKGEYGATPVDVDPELRARVLKGEEPIKCRPADNLSPEFDGLKKDLQEKGKQSELIFGENIEDDVLTYALFPKVALKFFENRYNPGAFEDSPDKEDVLQAKVPDDSVSEYTVEVEGERFFVKVSEGSDLKTVERLSSPAPDIQVTDSGQHEEIKSPLAGTVFKINVSIGDKIQPGEAVLVLEAMKMETEIQAASPGRIKRILVQEGDAVDVDQLLITVA
ncbi:MAG: oxaloacetate decarboxylase subunit alpha [Gammaproteobacteria bacterium]|nr:oxaloacetate decarboxylase subunit alpha [Gammaproteobacteria bacterium]